MAVQLDPSPMVTIAFRASKALKDQLDREARETGISTSDIIRMKLKKPFTFGAF